MRRKNIFLIAFALLLVGMLSSCTSRETPETGATMPTEQPITLPMTQETMLPSTAPELLIPESLGECLQESGTDIDALTARDCRQLVTVSVTDTRAQICFYTLEGNAWKYQETLTCSGFVGKRGAVDDKREGDLATPKGLYSIGDAFYRKEAPQTGLYTFPITPDTYWVDDPDSIYYNKRIEGLDSKDWKSAERMQDYTTAYEYGFVVDYNVEAVPGAGSAIFFHVGYAETAGCIATEREFVLDYLAALDKSCNPYILIF